MLWEGMEQDIPYANLDPADIREKVTTGSLLPMPRTASMAIQDVIKACWTLDQNSRPPMAEALQMMRHAASGGSVGAARARRPRTAGASMTGGSTRPGGIPVTYLGRG